MTPPTSLIINSPYEVPLQHWQQARDGSLTLTPERRPAGYEIFDARHNTRRTETLDLVNNIRRRVDAWREAGYPGITSVTRRLLEHWYDRTARQFPFYYCQLEAIGTLIWLIEASPEYKQGIHVPGDGGAWQRLCSKMATGTGKTTVMAMIITWQVLNALTYPKRNKDFSRAVFIVAPGITVKERCFDLSATPFAPTGKASSVAGLFDWIVSDFGLNDAIEAGLVKTPRVVIRDDALPDTKTFRSKLYHIYRDPEVADDLNRKAEAHESLPKLVQDAYTLLGADWRETQRLWREAGHTSPPVMLTVCNRTETSARIERYFRHGDAHWPELHAPERTLRVDSRVLEKAEIGESAASDKDYETTLKAIVEAADIPKIRKVQLRELKKEELLRELIDNVGKRAALDFWVQCVNTKGGFGVWCCDVAFVPAQLQDILAKHAC